MSAFVIRHVIVRGTVAGLCVVLELSFLAGRARLAGRDVHALMTIWERRPGTQ